MLKTSDFDFNLPENLIAQQPFFPREKTKMLLWQGNEIIDAQVINLADFLQEGDVLHDCMEVHLFNGHTLGMIEPLIHLPNGNKLLYGADLFPSSNHLKPNFAMG
jgi:hypothetical protein